MSQTALIEVNPSLTELEKLVDDLEKRGVKFSLCSKEKAIEYLKEGEKRKRLPLVMYCFDLNSDKALKGIFIDLDFEYLKDLYELDEEVRSCLFRILIIIEEYLITRIKKTLCVLSSERRMEIINEFLSEDYDGKNNDSNKRRIHNSIANREHDPIVHAILKKNNVEINQKIQNLPLDDFLELLTFGELIKFFEFYSKNYNLDDYRLSYLLGDARKLRNAIAHGQLILCDLKKINKNYQSKYKLILFLKKHNLGKTSMTNKLKNPIVREITSTICIFNEFVDGENTRQFVKSIISDLFSFTLTRNKEYYDNNYLLRSTFFYFKRLTKKIFDK